ncbi:hypothetical protein [Streptomyces arboris]|uniref:hypothetical protein n=1 Tax=Streptomyces arboris TaxID=2600619 RepID=UPI001CEF71D6|nr:hypothetical protein [Streptomyces arboris]
MSTDSAGSDVYDSSHAWAPMTNSPMAPIDSGDDSNRIDRLTSVQLVGGLCRARRGRCRRQCQDRTLTVPGFHRLHERGPQRFADVVDEFHEVRSGEAGAFLDRFALGPVLRLLGAPLVLMVLGLVVREGRERQGEVWQGRAVAQGGEEQHGVDRRQNRLHVHKASQGRGGLLDGRVVVLGRRVSLTAVRELAERRGGECGFAAAHPPAVGVCTWASIGHGLAGATGPDAAQGEAA